MPSEQMTSLLRAIAASEHPSVEASWTTPVSTPLWNRLCHLHVQEELLSLEHGEARERKRVSLGPVLPEQGEPRIAGLVVERALESPEGHEVLQWKLEVGPRPPGEPPEFFKKLHENLGGRAGLIELITSALRDSAMTVAHYEIKFLLDGALWDSRLVPRQLSGDVDAPILELSPEARIEHVGYRLPAGTNGIYEIVLTYFHEQPMHMVSARARSTLKLAREHWLPFADEVRDLLVAKLFSRKEQRI